jgi:hypothetical protein
VQLLGRKYIYLKKEINVVYCGIIVIMPDVDNNER